MARAPKHLPSKLWSSLTHPFLRQMVTLPPIPAGLEISIAETQEDLTGAYKLLHDVYVEIGFMEQHPSQMRLNVYNMLPHTSTIVAKIDGKVIGTVSLIRENPLGLPLDEIIDTSFYRKPGWQVAEITSLAVSKEWRGGGKVLFPLLKFVYEFAVTHLKVDVFQIATALSKADFFRALLFFEPITEQIYRDPLINGTLVTALYLDLNHAKAQFKRTYGARPVNSNMYTYFTSLDLPCFQFPKQITGQALNPVLTPDLFKSLFTEKTNLTERLGDREIHVLRDIYRSTPFKQHLPEPNSMPPYPPRRVAQRFIVSCPAVLESELGDEMVLLLDVSESGFRLFSKMPMRLTHDCHFRIHLTEQHTIPVIAKPIWNRRQREWGFTLLNVPQGWLDFLNHLELQLNRAA